MIHFLVQMANFQLGFQVHLVIMLRSQPVLGFQVNLKAELEIRHLHEKVDHLLSHQWERLAQIQEIQLELLAEISKKR